MNPTLIASLPMYDWPEVRSATDRVWAHMRHEISAAGLAGAPDQLERNCAMKDHWCSPQLLLSQTCGYPLTHEFDGRLQVLAAPVYNVPGCNGPNYSSQIIVSTASSFHEPSDLRGAVAAYNSDDSLSGLLALKAVFAPLSVDGKFFSQTVRSGGHGNSMKMVAEGAADVAAIDCVGFALAKLHTPQIAEKLRVVAQSPSAPSLPYVTAPGRSSQDCEILKAALASAMSSPDLEAARAALFLGGVEFLERKDYDRVLEIEAEIRHHQYDTLA